MMTREQHPSGPLVFSEETDPETALQRVPLGPGGRANPDLPEHIRTGAPLNEPDEETFRSGAQPATRTSLPTSPRSADDRVNRKDV